MALILASKSPRRREILTNSGFSFDIIVSDIEEIVDHNLSPYDVAAQLAKQKAQAVVANKNYNMLHNAKYPNNNFDMANNIVLAADTIVVLDGEILGKPANREEAEKMLFSLSGRVHKVFTGVCIMSNKKLSSFAVETEVQFYPLSKEDIEAYAATDEPYDKAGAYGIQGLGSLLVERINGDYFNVMGLPISRIARELRDFNIFPNMNIKD